eukprot:1162073-Pelagomonas_calceolata.AAC.1
MPLNCSRAPGLHGLVQAPPPGYDARLLTRPHALTSCWMPAIAIAASLSSGRRRSTPTMKGKEAPWPPKTMCPLHQNNKRNRIEEGDVELQQLASDPGFWDHFTFNGV